MKTMTLMLDMLKDKMNVTRYVDMPEEPDDIQVKKITDVLRVNPENRYLTDGNYDNDMQLIEAKSVDVKSGRILYPFTTTTKGELPKRARLIAKKGDILLPTVKTSHINPTYNKGDNYIVSDYFAVLVPKRNIDPYYLIAALKEDYVKKQIRAYYYGSYTEKINIEDLKQVKIRWPAKNKRQEMGLDIKEELREVTPEEREKDLRKDIDQLFSDHFGISKEDLEHVKSKVCDYDKFEKLKAWNIDLLLKPDLNSRLTDIEIKVYKLKDVTLDISMGIQYRDLGKIDEKLLIKGKELKVLEINKAVNINSDSAKNEYKLHKGDITIRIKGKIGPAAYVKDMNIGLYHYHDTARISVKDDLVEPEYLAMYLNSFIAKFFMNLATKKKTMKYINISSLEDIPVILPPIEDQQGLASDITAKL